MKDDPGEKLWLDKFYTGNNEIIGLWYQKFSQPLHLVAYRYLNDAELARDAVHDIFEKLIKYNKTQRIEKFKPKSSIFNSLKLRVRMHSIDIIRKNKRRPAISIDNILQIDLKNVDPYTRIELQDLLTQAIRIAKRNNLLNDIQLRLLDYYLKDYSNPELAEKLQLPKEKVAKEKFKLRIILKRQIIKLRES